MYEKIINENEEKGTQLRLVLGSFKGKEYLHLRKYFLSFEDGYVPSKEGASMEATISNIYALLDGMLEIVSNSEGVDAIEQHFSDKLTELRSRNLNLKITA